MFESVKKFLAEYNISFWSTDSDKQKPSKRVNFDFSKDAWNRLVEMSNDAGQTPQVFASNAMRESLLLKDLLATAKAQGHNLIVGIIREDGSREEIELFK